MTKEQRPQEEKFELARLGEFKCQINPQTFAWGGENQYAQGNIHGAQVDPLEFTGSTGDAFPVEIFLEDSKATGQKNFTEDAILKLSRYWAKDSNTGSPPVLEFQYGTLLMDVVIVSWNVLSIRRERKSAKIRRATISLQLRQYVEEEYTRTIREEKGERIYQVQESRLPVAGETFRNIAWRELSNPDLGDAIRDYNSDILLHCRGPVIPGGTIILIPGWDWIKENGYLTTNAQGLVEYD